MGSSKDRKPRWASSQVKTRDGLSETAAMPRWKKMSIGIGSILATAVAGALTGVLQTMFSFLVSVLGPPPAPPPAPSGDPVSAFMSLREFSTDISLPESRPLTDQDLQQLNELNYLKQASWLRDRGGIPTGFRQVQITLKSNRDHLVRVTDLHLLSECEEVSRGTLVRTSLNTGVAIGSIMMVLDVAQPDKAAEYGGPGSKAGEPYFPQRTIILEDRSKQDYIVLLLTPPQSQLCHVRFELTIVDDDKEVRQTLDLAGKSIPVLPQREDKEEYRAVYLGANVCKRVVRAPKDYLADLRAACGPGNYKEHPLK
jgi:hypothetical protein